MPPIHSTWTHPNYAGHGIESSAPDEWWIIKRLPKPVATDQTEHEIRQHEQSGGPQAAAAKRKNYKPYLLDPM
jgi:hypothetical protein